MLTKIPISQVAKVGAGQGAPKHDTDFSENGYPFIRAGHLEDLINKLPENELPKVDELTAKKYRLKLYSPGTIVFAKSGMSATKGRIYALKSNCYVVNHLATLEINDYGYSPYIQYALREYSPTKLVKDKAYPSISKPEIESFKIPLPQSKNDQIRIAEVLSKVERLIAKRKESINLLDELLKSTFLEMFGNYFELKKKKFGTLSKHIEFLTSGSRGWAKYYSESGAKFLRINNVGFANIKTEDLVYVNPPDSAEANRTRVQENDLLLSITADLGRTAVVPPNFGEAYINQHLALIRLKKEIHPIYAAYFYALPYGNRAIQGKNRAAVKAGLNFNDIRTLPFQAPLYGEQKKFALIVSKVELLKTNLKSSLDELKNLYSSLSQLAFNGELDLTNIKIKESEYQIIEEEKKTEKEDEIYYDIKKPPIVINLENAVVFFLKEHYSDIDFSADDLIQDLTDPNTELKLSYFTSEELKFNSTKEDLKDIIFNLLDGNNQYVKLEQFYYEQRSGIEGLRFSTKQIEKYKNKGKDDFSGLYLRIKK